MKALKQKKCKACRELFTPFNSMTKACSVKCALVVAKDSKDKEYRRETKRLKQKIKFKSCWLSEAQTEFNKFIRLRDMDKPCISCGRHHDGQYHAGHYRTVGAHPELRFTETNCHKQCAPCNNHKSGNIVEYRINLAKRLTSSQLHWLEGPHKPLKLTIDDIKAIKEKYNRKYKELKEME